MSPQLLQQDALQSVCSRSIPSVALLARAAWVSAAGISEAPLAYPNGTETSQMWLK